MFNFHASNIPGCYEIQPRVMEDHRGRLVKIFHSEIFTEQGLSTDFKEEYYSYSKKNVVRGMHFQVPPHEHAKIVYCIIGEVFDAVLDLRVGSPTYGKTASYRLSAERGNYLFIPKGLAHGFCSISDLSIMVYKVSTVYAPQHDTGVLWSSIGVNWPCSNPIVSERDTGFLPLDSRLNFDWRLRTAKLISQAAPLIWLLLGTGKSLLG